MKAHSIKPHVLHTLLYRLRFQCVNCPWEQKWSFHGPISQRLNMDLSPQHSQRLVEWIRKYITSIQNCFTTIFFHSVLWNCAYSVMVLKVRFELLSNRVFYSFCPLKKKNWEMGVFVCLCYRHCCKVRLFIIHKFISCWRDPKWDLHGH